MNAKKLEYFRQKLLEMRSQIMNRSAGRRTEALQISLEDIVDENDHAAAMVQQSISLNVQERDRFVLREIENALSKFEDGVYGICEDTEEPIDEGRLEAQPWTRYCVEAAEAREKRASRFAKVG
jgi:DnaK suppressor protein